MIGLSGVRMKGFLTAVYTALVLGANPVAADPALEGMRQGEMRKLVVHAEPIEVSQARYGDLSGGAHALSDLKGRVAVVNFWATWCAPCRAEMPALDRLRAELAPEGVEVIAIATGHNRQPAIEAFYEDAKIRHLPILLDPKKTLAQGMGVVGLPVTVVLDREGREVARMIGEAEWDSAEAKALLRVLAAR